MDWLKTRLVIVSVVVMGGVALGFAQTRGEFAYLDLHDSDGRAFSLHAVPSHSDGTLTFEGAGIQALVELPEHVLPGATATVLARLHPNDRFEPGQLQFNVQEAGRFLSGTLRGEIGSWAITGGLRIRRTESDGLPQQLARE